MDALIFDIDGTLIQSADIDDALYRASVTAVLGAVRFRECWSDYERVTDSGILAQVLEDNDLTHTPDRTATIQAHFVRALEAHVAEHGPFREMPGARAYLAHHLESPEHGVAIATGGWRASALLKLRSAGFETTRIPIATSDDDHDRSRIMQAALEKLGRSCESVTYYGDGTWDRDACRELGWNFVPVGRALNGLESFSVSRSLTGDECSKPEPVNEP